MTGFEVHRPDSIGAAVMLASQFGDAASYLAGGSDLMVQINRRRRALTHLIALGNIAELSGVEVSAERAVIGALTTMKEIKRHPAFAASPLAALREAAQVVGGHQVRNVATIGGNVVNASPAADLMPVLLALDAELALSSATGDRRLPLGDFLCGPGLTTRHPGELLRQVTFTPPRGAASAFLKAGRRRAMEISLVCVAVLLQLDERRRCRNVRIALGAVGPTAIRARDAEMLLHGAEPSAAAFRAVADAATAACAPIDDVRASAWYRRRLVTVMVARALQQCCDRIGARAA